jgi:hypothetical protein
VEIVVPLLVFIALGTVTVMVAVRAAHPRDRAWLQRTLLLALFARIAIAAIFELFPQLRLFHDDANGYEIFGVRLALSWQGKFPPIDDELGGNPGYYYVAGILCYLFGPFRLNVPLFNTLIGTLTVFLIFRLARRHFHLLVARRAALLVAFTPSMMLWSSMALKDSLVTLLVIIALSACISLKTSVTVRNVAGVLLPLLALQPLRFYMVYFVGFSVMVALVLDRGARVITGVYKQIYLVGAAVLLFSIVGLSGRAVEGAEYISLERVSTFRRGMAASARSGFGQDVDISTPDRAIEFLPIGLANLLLAPFPWQMTSLRPLVAAPETIAWWLLVPATLSGLRFVMRRRFNQMSPLLMFTASLACAYALMHGNIGSAFRQRAQIFVFLFIFASLGWYQSKCRRAGIDQDLLLRGEAEDGEERVKAPSADPALRPRGAASG